jgi:hypothetical protein
MLQPHRFIVVLALGALAALPRVTPAQGLAEVCKAVGDAKTGQWASFDATSVSSTEGGKEEPGKLRLAVVGSERDANALLYWFEVKFTGKDPSHSGVVQILSPSLASGTAAPHAVIVKAGLQPAMRLSGQMAGLMGTNGPEGTSALDWAARCNGAHVIGWESVTVPAGSFRALHVTTDEGADVWASREVPFGLIKTHGKRGDLVLTGQGSDAKSSITEKPVEMSLPGMMPKP